MLITFSEQCATAFIQNLPTGWGHALKYGPLFQSRGPSLETLLNGNVERCSIVWVSLLGGSSAGRTALALDIRYGADNDINTALGFCNSLLCALRVQSPGQAVLAPVCSSWVWVNRHTSKRSSARPLGHTQVWGKHHMRNTLAGISLRMVSCRLANRWTEHTWVNCLRGVKPWPVDFSNCRFAHMMLA